MSESARSGIDYQYVDRGAIEKGLVARGAKLFEDAMLMDIKRIIRRDGKVRLVCASLDTGNTYETDDLHIESSNQGGLYAAIQVGGSVVSTRVYQYNQEWLFALAPGENLGKTPPSGSPPETAGAS